MRLQSWVAVLGVVAFGYVAIAAAMFFLQDRFLYFPSSAGLGQARFAGLARWPEEGAFVGLQSLDPPANPRGTVLVWHGNAGAAVDRAYYVRALEPRGLRVILLEYPGYGGRSGPLGEASFVNDAVAATERARTMYDGPLYLVGESLGTGVASAVAGRLPQSVDGVLLITPFATLNEVAQSGYPWLPVRWLMRDRFDSVRSLASYPGPVAVAIASRDEVIPNDQSQRLYDSIRSRKLLTTFEDSGHNDWPSGPDEPWWDDALAFLAGS
jgi:alpha-beta hydrolase superfamily lysophospholipase